MFFALIVVYCRIITERFDGWRAIWNGKGFTLRTTKDNNSSEGGESLSRLLIPPLWFQQQLPPSTHLDGKLWCGYGQFYKLSRILNHHKEHIPEEEWKQIFFVVVDTPDNTIKHNPYMIRHKAVAALLLDALQHT